MMNAVRFKDLNDDNLSYIEFLRIVQAITLVSSFCVSYVIEIFYCSCLYVASLFQVS